MGGCCFSDFHHFRRERRRKHHEHDATAGTAILRGVGPGGWPGHHGVASHWQPRNCIPKQTFHWKITEMTDKWTQPWLNIFLRCLSLNQTSMRIDQANSDSSSQNWGNQLWDPCFYMLLEKSGIAGNSTDIFTNEIESTSRTTSLKPPWLFGGLSIPECGGGDGVAALPCSIYVFLGFVWKSLGHYM